MPFAYSSGNPDNLVGGGPARMQDIQGPLYDIRAYLNSVTGSGGGGSTAVLTARQVSDVGVLNQVRAGRQLTVADFTGLGLSQPVGLWNLGDLTNLGSSGAGGVLANKGSVPFGVGINGNSTTAAVFSGSTGQALYVADTGASDPFRIKTGSWGCWFKTAKRATEQVLISKDKTGAGNRGWWLEVNTANVLWAILSADGTATPNVVGVSDVADDRWHFGVSTVDGTTVRLYVDGVLEGTISLGPLSGTSGPLNIGALQADGGTPGAAVAHYGRVDEAFVTPDVLTDDQIRCLYAIRLTHTLAAVPSDVRLNVTRRRKGAALVVADFTTQPLRLHNFTAGALTDEGSGGQALTNNGTAVAVAGADGSPAGAFSFAGAQSLSATDAGLPAGTASRSYGCWFKTTTLTATVVLGWGTQGTADARLVTQASGVIAAQNGADVILSGFVADGQWHLIVLVEDNTAGDGVRRKMYVDGRLAGGSTVLNAITLAGANRFRVGAQPDGTAPFIGQVDAAFVTGYAIQADEIARLYSKSAAAIGASPKNAGDHVEAVSASDLLFIGDSLESQWTVDVGVVS